MHGGFSNVGSQKAVRFNFRTVFLAGGRVGWFYAAVILSFMALEDRVLFARLGVGVDPPNRDIAEIQLEAEDGIRLHAWYCPCPAVLRTNSSDHPVVLYCHGSSGDHTARWAPAFHLQRTLGADVLLFSYRGFGRSEGSPSEAGLYRDGRAAWNYLTYRRGIHPSRIILYGESLGSGVATELAVAFGNAHRALVLQSAYTSIPDIVQNIAPWAPVGPMIRNEFSSIGRIGKHRRPLILIHGELDPLVPFAHAKRLYEAAARPKLLIARPDRGHNEVLDLRVFDEIAAFLKASEGGGVESGPGERPTS
jgi:fermentation-respiration switch protein FrsA (DUF1100 family)